MSINDVLIRKIIARLSVLQVKLFNLWEAKVYAKTGRLVLDDGAISICKEYYNRLSYALNDPNWQREYGCFSRITKSYCETLMELIKRHEDS